MDQPDELDLRIIRLLEDDGRLSNVEVARNLGISEATARRRIERLLANHSIAIVAIPDPKLVTEQVEVLIAIQAETGMADTVADHLAALPETRYVAVVSGPFDVLVELIVPSHSDLLNVLRVHILERSEIKMAQTIMILRHAKINSRLLADAKQDAGRDGAR